MAITCATASLFYDFALDIPLGNEKISPETGDLLQQTTIDTTYREPDADTSIK